MIKLNLLPPEEKTSLQTERIFSCLFYYCKRIFAILIIFILALAGIWIFLRIQIEKEENALAKLEKSNFSQEIKSFEKEIEAANKAIAQLETIQKESILYSKILEDLSLTTADNIQLSGFIFDKKTNKGSLSGYALERESFISFKNSLEKSAYFSEINSPVSNLVKSADNNFVISFSLK
jgi:Tfp pilus assembly protein PilN